MSNTPPTEDRDWKERFDENFARAGFRSNNIDWKVCAPEIKNFISQEITAAEARGYEIGLSAGRMEANMAFGKPIQSNPL